MRIALVPYKPGQEPEGMVSSLDPEQYDEKGVLDADIDNAETHLTAIAAAVKAAKRDERIRTLEEFKLRFMPSLANPLSFAEETLREMARALGVDYEPESAEDVPSVEERNRRQRAGLCRLCGAVREEGRWCWCKRCYNSDASTEDSEANEDAIDEILREIRAEDVPELWVSRDAGGGADLWEREPKMNVNRVWWPRGTDPDGWRMPNRLAQALALKPGTCRRVTKSEYERYFRPVLKLDPSERCAALERMVP